MIQTPDALAIARRQRTGLLIMVLAASSYGLVAIFAKLAYAEGSTTGQALTWRFVLASVLLYSGLRLRRVTLGVNRSQLLRLIGLGALGYFGQALMFFLALQFIPASMAALLLNVAPVLVAVLAWFLWRAPLTRVKLTALALAVLGGGLVVGTPASEPDPRGVIFAGLCALLYAGYLLTANQAIGPLPRQTATIYIMGSATLSFALYAQLTGGIWPATTLGGWAAYLAMGLASVIAMIAFFAGLELLGPSRAAIVGTLEPVVTVAAAALILREAISLPQIVGGAFIVGAVVVLNLGSQTPAPDPGPA